jgi:succinate dehydrogenase hydrophobic anchor subunit
MATNLHAGKRGVEAWWGFLAGALIIIAVVIFLLVLFAKIKGVSMGSVSSIGQNLSHLFK